MRMGGIRGGAARIAAAFLAGAVMVSSAWAGASLLPVADGDSDKAVNSVLPAAGAGQAGTTPPSADSFEANDSISLPNPASLPQGQVLAGAARTSIEPRPADYNGTWETRRSRCARLDPDGLQGVFEDPVEAGDHLAASGSTWHENPNCIYMGGFGIGPMNPVSSWNKEYGLWVRAFAVRDRQGDDLVLVVLDGEGYFWDYANKCSDCGSKQLTEQLAADDELGLEAKDVVIAATHAHSSPDFIGGWGFVPGWYMRQVADTIKGTVRAAVASMRPAVLEYGEKLARPFNNERRSTYRSAEEQQLAWLRAYAAPQDPGTSPRKSPSKPSAPAPPKTIATLGAYAAHPTAFGTNGGEAHPDWPGMFEKNLEERFGGVGLHFMTGLGNMSNSGLRSRARVDELAARVSGVGTGDRIENPDIRTARTTWQQPVTNAPLTALGVPGFFDRKFSGPSHVETGKNPSQFQCDSAAPHSAEVPASAARIGSEVALTAAPGEIFSNFSNTIKEQSGAQVSLPLGQSNDALGYMPQNFEMSVVGQQGPGFVDGLKGLAVVNYEDAYSIDKCFGDMTLETSIKLLNGL
jgi:hypothetical protein